MEENTIDTADRISLLPEFIVHQILSNLLDFPEALIRMSVLSKDWFALTASFPILDFRIRKILFCKQNVSAHTLTIDTNPAHVVLAPADVEILKDCLESVLKKGLHVLEIRIEYPGIMPMLRLPNILSSVSELSSLTISEC
ncbi:F-box domain containing protein [Tanacetum coccineum]